MSKYPFLDKKYITGKFIRPLAGNPRISGAYHEKRGDTLHPGVDYAVGVNTLIYAPAPGVALRADGTNTTGYGNQLRLWHSQFKITSIYGHLTAFLVRPGELVQIGQPIALSGGDPNDNLPGDGHSGGPHLHWELQVGKSKFGRTETLDPLAVILKWKVA